MEELLAELKQKATTVQTLIMSKDKFKSSTEAKKWAKDHKFRADKVDENDESYRLRQRNPKDFDENSFKTITLTDGVKAVIGKLKKKDVDDELMALYGTSDIEEILEEKASKNQERSYAGKPKRVEMSVDECKKLCKKVGLDYMEGYEARVIEYTITDETPDRYGDIVRASGVDFKTNYFPKNPTVQYAHQYGMLPVGKTLKIWKEDKSVKAQALFYDNRIDDTGFSDTVFKFVESNAMPGVSIGFIPIEANRPKNADEREKIGLGEYGIEFKKVDLLEYSPCAIGANPNALKNSLIDSTKRGVFNKRDIDSIEKLVPEDIFEDIKKEIEEQKEPNTDTVDVEKVVESAIKEVLEEKISPLIEKATELIEKMESLENKIEQLNITFKPKESPGSPEPSEQEKSAEDIYDLVDEEIVIGEGNNN